MVNKFVSSAGKPAFWEDADDDFFEDSHPLWFLKQVGLGDSPYFLEEINKMTRQQSVEGHILKNANDQSGPLRVLVAVEPESKTLSSALDYWLDNWKEMYLRPDGLAIGVLALTELNWEKHSHVIREQIDYLKSSQNEDGSWSASLEANSDEGNLQNTSYALWAISRVDGAKSSVVHKAQRWIEEGQLDDGSWKGHIYYTTRALIGLLAVGEGPKLPLEVVNQQLMKMKQSLRRPVFVHTSPMYQKSLHVKEIYSRISSMLHGAQKEIRIASPFIDMLYEEIINLTETNPNLDVKIITRPKGEGKGLRQRIVRNVIDLLNIATKGNVTQSTLVHSRMVIADADEVLISSADLTRDQLFDEFNAGIWTSDKTTVKKAIDFFENLVQIEQEKCQ